MRHVTARHLKFGYPAPVASNETSARSGGVTYAGVALLFAICGACSSIHVLDWFPDGPGLMLPVPFAPLCWLLFLRQWRATIAVPLMVVVWVVAFAAAHMAGYAGCRRSGTDLRRIYRRVWVAPLRRDMSQTAAFTRVHLRRAASRRRQCAGLYALGDPV